MRMIEPVYEKGYPCWDAVNNKGKYEDMAKLPEGRKALTDQDMVILLHNIARSVEQFGSSNLSGSEMRQTADRFSELAKAASVAQHKAEEG